MNRASKRTASESIVLAINSLQGGGAEKFVLTIGDAFFKLGYEVHVLRFNDTVEHTLNKNLNYHLVNYQNYRWLPKGKIRYSTFAKIIDRYIEKKIGKPKLVLSNLERSDNIFAYSRLPNVVYVIHSTLSLYYNFTQSKNIDSLIDSLKLIYSKHPCVCVSDGVKQDFIKYLGNMTELITIHNPVDREAIMELSDEFIPEFSNYIINIGSFKKAKRHDILLKAYKSTDMSMPLLLAGQGKLKEEVSQLACDLGIEDKVIFLGFCKNPYPYLKHASLKILSSDREGCPMVLAEALALEVAVISTDCQSGPRELLPSENLMQTNDIDAISFKLRQAIKDPNQFKANFDESLLPEVVAKKYLSIIEDKN